MSLCDLDCIYSFHTWYILTCQSTVRGVPMSKDKSEVTVLFPTLVYRTDVGRAAKLNLELEAAALSLAQEDRVGLQWCTKHGYSGYTSYASIDDLAERISAFARLERIIDRHAARFAKVLHWDLRGGRPLCDSMWVNVLSECGSHTS